MSNNPVLVKLSSPGIIKISGIDAKKFLQGQLTCNVEEVNLQQSRLGAHCNPQGRIISLFQLFQLGEDYYLYLPQSMISIALAALKKYAVFYKIQFSEVGEEFSCFEYMSPSDDLALLGFATPSAEVGAVYSGSDWNIIKLAHHRYLLLAESGTALPKNLPISSEAYLAKFNIVLGQPNIYPETSAKLLPHDINLQKTNGVSFNKGCYTGQEIIARMHYKGKLKNHLYALKVKHQLPLFLGSEITLVEKNIRATIVEVYNDASHSELLIVAPLLDEQAKNFLDANHQSIEVLEAPLPL